MNNALRGKTYASHPVAAGSPANMQFARHDCWPSVSPGMELCAATGTALREARQRAAARGKRAASIEDGQVV